MFCTLVSDLIAQDTLSVAHVIETGIENNFSIRIAKNDYKTAINDNTLGNSGFLPTVYAEGALNERIEDSKTRYNSSSFSPRDDDNAKTTIYTYGVNASWTVFDGLTMFATKDRLELQENRSEIETQLQIENVLSDIISTYYQIAGLQKAHQVLRNTVEISEERIRIAETKRDLGSGSEYDLLQASADFNEDRAGLIRSGTTLKQTKLYLKELIADTLLQSDFAVQADIVLAEPLSLSLLLDDAVSQNKELTIARYEHDIARQRIKEIQGEWLPSIALNGSYNYSKTEAGSGITNYSETKGFRYGITARLNFFNGFDTKRRKQNAEIVLKNELLRQEELDLSLSSQIQQVYVQYSDALSLIGLEKENLHYSSQSLDIALERFRLGTINSVELREAQQSLLNAENRLIAAQIEAKTAETELLRLSGRLFNKAE